MNLFLRVISSIILLPLFLYAVFIGKSFLAILLSTVGFLSLIEVSRMIFPSSAIIATISACSSFVFCLASMVMGYDASISILMALTIAIFAHFVFHVNESKEKLEAIAMLVMTGIYVLVPLILIYKIRHHESLDAMHGGFLFLILGFLATWGNDTIAYFVGRKFGKRKLIPLVSEKKTWEGFFGGACGSLFCVAVGYGLITALMEISTIFWYDALCIAAPCTVLAPLGDLLESRIKRFYHVKDSGFLIPGHGGVLDRIDALLVTVPWIYCYAHFIRPWFSL